MYDRNMVIVEDGYFGRGKHIVIRSPIYASDHPM